MKLALNSRAYTFPTRLLPYLTPEKKRLKLSQNRILPRSPGRGNIRSRSRTRSVRLCILLRRISLTF